MDNIKNLLMVINDIVKDSKEELISKYHDPYTIGGIFTSPRAYQVAVGKATRMLLEAIEQDSDRIEDLAKYAFIVINAEKHRLDYKKAAKDFKIGK